MSQWQPNDPRRSAGQPPAVQSQQWQGYGQPPQPYPPAQPYGYPQQWQQPPVQVNVTQNAYGPSRAVTQGKLGFLEEIFHWTMIVCTCGLWLPVYLSRKRSKRSVTVFR